MRPMSTRSSSQDLPCQICYLNYPNSVSWSQISLHQFLREAHEAKTVKFIEMTWFAQLDDLFERNVFPFLVFHRSRVWTQVLYAVLG